MKISAAAAALLSLAVPTATAWTAVPTSTSIVRSSSVSIRSPSLLQSTTVKDAAVEEVAAAPDTGAREFGVVNTNKLSKLYDLVVIGGGPAGVAGAIKAAQMGRRAIVIDKPKFDAGVLPMDWICSLALRDLAKSTNVGALRAQEMESDVIWKQITNEAVCKGHGQSEDGLRSVKVTHTGVLDDYVGFVDDAEVTVTGTKFFTISGLGIIGIEFANIFNALGVKDVNILVRGDVETSTKKLGMDMDVANELMRLLTESGVKVLEVHLSVTDDEYIEMKLNDGSTMQTDLFFAATGRYPLVADRGMVGIDKKTLATSSKNVYAAGDVIGDDDVTKDANHDDPLSIGVWTIPEMGYFGLTKEQAEKEGYSVVEGTARFDQCLHGLCKLVVDEKEGTVLGCHLIGKEAAEMVHYGMALVKAGTSIFEILQTVYTAVTFHELFKEAALDANSKLDFGVEWQEIFAILQSECDIDFSEDYLREKFDSIDEDGSGELDEEEMRALFESMGRTVSKRVIFNIMRLSDTDGNGTIDFGEFKAIFDKIACPKDEE
ncbi:putative dihydrolipoamide dehydrogenase [Skeletonema marinoi]|uniref:Dihydrolipoamide dehydrogenase n=1 Tax=Skeletonema marinoi TaxID=267567 RepID=A0AAD8XT19_9STRA|nr:putative dihydrolipoamide dehydrogenase [Skeletonema marinoi]